MKKTYMDKVHIWGRIWVFAAIVVLMSVPLAISIHYDAWPEAKTVLKALLSVALIYWTSAIIEVITYTPMLGAGGTYLSFITGNITNLKLPCSLNAMENAKVRANSEEGEVISTIAIGVSSIVTTVVIAIGVLCFTPILPKITAEGSVFKAAFDQVLPALFGALAASYFRKHWKISIFPILVGCLVLVFAPELGVGTLIFITIIASVGGAFAMVKLNIIK
ncbi:MAG: hypothetical protein PUK72_07805 [Oscillospiraceae bacterium]|nr:hypothetical protein [Oscillospiraceae bacterium]MDD7470976.1 hypothetical protein [Oscillospiraceae bacterium]MDY2678070.1 hypothetical protein [Oscillospiraceae bacterium]